MPARPSVRARFGRHYSHRRAQNAGTPSTGWFGQSHYGVPGEEQGDTIPEWWGQRSPSCPRNRRRVGMGTAPYRGIWGWNPQPGTRMDSCAVRLYHSRLRFLCGGG